MKKRAPLYSSASRGRPTSGRAGAGVPPGGPAVDAGAARAPAPGATAAPPGAPSPHGALRRRFAPRGPQLLIAAVGVCVLVLALALVSRTTAPREVTQQDIDAAVLRSLETQPLPSRSAKAYQVIRPSVVRVRGLAAKPKDDGKMDGKGADRGGTDRKGADRKGGDNKAPEAEEAEQGVGTGVVIVDKGIILTNLHVVAGAERVKVVFADGLESDAEVIGLRPEHDLAVLQAKTVPDDLTPATMRSTHDLQPGDEVVAVGFPFGIGPSASAGVVSGLRREFRSEKGERVLTNLIQFDAAANPGSSGGPLVTLDGAVIGIVTAILNPSEQRVFIGIGFAVPIENAASAAGIPPF